MKKIDSLNIFRPKSPGTKMLSGNNNSFIRYWKTLNGLALKAKMLAWWSKEEATASYYIDRIGSQEREALTQDDIAGVLWNGRAINYNGALSQYSILPAAHVPANCKLVNNSLSFSFWIKADASASTGTRDLFDNLGGTSSGKIAIYISYPQGILRLNTRSSGGAKEVNLSATICDGNWHHILAVISVGSFMKIYVDKVLNDTEDMTGYTFGDITTAFNFGGSTSYFTGGNVALRDFRIFPSVISSDADILTLYNQEYLAGAAAWWLMEDSSWKYLSPSVGSNLYLLNTAFTAESYVTGFWRSLLNRFGYSHTTKFDIIYGDGAFSNASLWTIGAAWTISDGVASFSGASTNSVYCNRAISYATTDTITISFKVLSASARLYFTNQSDAAVLAVNTYTTGTHSITFNPANAGTRIRIYSYAGDPACIIDDFTFSLTSPSPTPPRIDKSVPDSDLNGASLVFTGIAKRNLLISGLNTKMPNEGDIYESTELVSVNDWFNAGVAQEIAWDAIDYEFGRQYVNDKEFILIKNTDANFPTLTYNESKKLRQYLKLSTPPEVYNAGVCFSMDDTWNSANWVEADSLLSQYGWKCTFAITTRETNTTEQQDIADLNQYKSNLDTLVAAGHELANHGLRHTALTTYLSSHTKQQYYDDIIAPLSAHMVSILGYTPKTFIYPSWFGTDSEMSNIVLAEGFQVVRENASSIPSPITSLYYNGNSQICLALDLDPYTGDKWTDEQIMELLVFARDYNVVLTILTHRIVESDPPATMSTLLSRMQMICQYVNDNNMKFYRYDELLPALFDK